MRTLLIVLLMVFALNCQHSVEQDIRDAINEELQGYVKKDFDLWARHWVNSDRTRYMRIDADSYIEVVSWDSLQIFFQGYFRTPPTKGYDQKKHDFEIHVDGDFASVYYLSTSIKPNLTEDQYHEFKNYCVMNKVDGE